MGTLQSIESNMRSAATHSKYTALQDDKEITSQVMSLVQNENVFAHFREGEALGEGSYGKVWVGECLKTGEEFAIKTIFNSDTEAQLGRELKVMLDANHPNLVKMHAVYQLKGGELHLVMDLVSLMKGWPNRTSSNMS